MVQVRPPLIAGVAGGVGTTTIANALQAVDCGRYRAGAAVDVLVARATLYSLGCAQHALAAAPRPPVLAVVAELPGASMSGPTRARLRMTEAGMTAAVVVPYVPDWIDVVHPHEAAAASCRQQGQKGLSRPVRAFVVALHRLIELVSPLVLTDPSVRLGTGLAAELDSDAAGAVDETVDEARDRDARASRPDAAGLPPGQDVPVGTFLDPYRTAPRPGPAPFPNADRRPFPSITQFHS